MLDDDLSGIFNANEHARQCTFENGAKPFAIFEKAFERSFGVPGKVNSDPALLIPTQNVPANVIDMTVTVQGKGLFRVVEVEEDFEPGLTNLILENA